MTDKRELLQLQDKARRAGRVCNFYIGADGYIDGVFYMDAKGPGRQRVGMVLDPIGFAERERAKPHWYEKLETSLARCRRKDSFYYGLKEKRSTV